MVFLDILVPIFVILVVALVLTQCLIPTAIGRPWFPMIHRNWQVRDKIGFALEENATGELEKKLEELKHKEKKDEPVSERTN